MWTLLYRIAMIVLLAMLIISIERLSVEGIPRVTSIERYYLNIAVKGTVNIPDDLKLFKKLAKEGGKN